MKKNNSHKLIFEGVELAGKSFVIHQIYDFLEKKYNTHPKILNGCHWFNSDVGIFGTNYGMQVIQKYLEIAEMMPEKNIIFEKLFISDKAYHSLYTDKILDYSDIENRLLKLDAKIIFCKISPDAKLFEKRLNDRISLYKHYGRIAQKPSDYIKQQERFEEIISQTKIPVLSVDLTVLPNPNVIMQILEWLGESQ